jgi:hypothetical protein
MGIFFVLVLNFIGGTNAYAGHADAIRILPADRSVLCEYYLANSHSAIAQQSLVNNAYSYPFVFQDIEPVSEAALKVLGFDREDTKSSLKSLLFTVSPVSNTADEIQFRVLQLNGVGVLVRQQQGFPDGLPIAWNKIRLSEKELKLSYGEIIERHPLRAKPKLGNAILGFTTDPNQHGIRIYVSLESSPAGNGQSAEVGLDVPCKRLKDFAAPDTGEVLVISESVTYCRVPVLYFARP